MPRKIGLNLATATLGAAAFAAIGAAGAQAQAMRPALTSESAQAIIAGCEAFAQENDLRVNITVLDQGRNLMAFLRMDGAPLGSIDIANWKANASASFRRATLAMNARAREFPAYGLAPNIAIFEGGEAIFTQGGQPLGGVGVSGASSADDAACARAGIAAAGLSHERG